jgi:type I restriction enzyme M protein
MSDSERIDIKNKIWEICRILRDDGMHIGSYVEQVTILLFLKMIEQRESKFDHTEEIEEKYRWGNLVDRNGEDLLNHYDDTLRALGNQKGLLGEIFGRVNSQFKTPVNLSNAVAEINEISWNEYGADVKGAAYESLLQRYAEEAKGAGQYFTPRAAIEAMVEVVDPEYDETVHDPAAGTSGFLIQSYEHVLKKNNQGLDLSREERSRLSEENLSGVELVPETRRLGLMNMVLHDLYGNIRRDDSLTNPPSKRFDIVIANPPYGGSNQEPVLRSDFFVETKSPELNFLQHCFTSLKDGGKCAIIVPDGVLFQGGQAERVREYLLKNVDLHTILILPDSAFHPYTGVQTNIMFFDKGTETDELWYYDLRTDIEGIKKSNKLSSEHFEEFLSNYDIESREGVERFFSVNIDDISQNNYDLNYKTYKEFSNTVTHRNPADVLGDLRETTTAIDEELDTLENILENEASRE